jgi:hypothetical protein
MGTFATTTALDTLMPGVSFDTATTALATKAIDWAENYAKGKLSKRYDTSAAPFTVYTSTSQLTSYTEQIAMGHVFKLHSRGGKEAISRGQALIEQAEESIMMIADRKCDLLDASTSTLPVTERATAAEIIGSASAYFPTFNEDDPLNWEADPDKLDDIASDRT